MSDADHANVALLERFYEAFQRRDHVAMGACYAPDVRFSDPVFPALVGDEARGMWRMLCEAGEDLTLTFEVLEADDTRGRARWEAHYTFGADEGRTGRKVHNIIDAEFRFADGLIAEHTDRFDLWRWTRMALGPVGVLLGWTPFLQGKVRAMGGKGLRKALAGYAA